MRRYAATATNRRSSGALPTALDFLPGINPLNANQSV